VSIDVTTWLEGVYLGNTMRDYLVAILLILLGVFASRFSNAYLGVTLQRLTRLTHSTVDDQIAEGAVGPLSAGFFLAFCKLAQLSLKLSETVNTFASNALFAAAALLAGVITNRAMDVVFREIIQPWSYDLGGQKDDQLGIFARKFGKATLWILLIIVTMEHVGLDMISLVTGLGLGGLAVALAAQETVANLLGSFQILADRPFLVRDWVKVVGRFGYVTEIGLRSTKIMTRGRILVSVPNKLLAESEIENWSIGGDLKVDTQVGLVYQTSAEHLEQATAILHEILDAQPGLGEGHLVHFLHFDESSLTLQITYFVTDIPGYWDIQHQVNVEIKRRFDAAGLDFAFPTRTIHMAKEEKEEKEEKYRPLG